MGQEIFWRPVYEISDQSGKKEHTDSEAHVDLETASSAHFWGQGPEYGSINEKQKDFWK